MDRLISEQAVIDRLSHWYSDMLETGKEQEDLIEVIKTIPSAEPKTGQYHCNECRRDILSKYEAEVITRGNCMMCGKKLIEGLFFCKECEEKVRIRDDTHRVYERKI